MSNFIFIFINNTLSICIYIPLSCVYLSFTFHERHKFSTESIQCAFMRCSTNHKAFLCYDFAFKKLCISSNVVLFKNQFFIPTCDQLFPDVAFFLALMNCLPLLNGSYLRYVDKQHPSPPPVRIVNVLA